MLFILHGISHSDFSFQFFFFVFCFAWAVGISIYFVRFSDFSKYAHWWEHSQTVIIAVVSAIIVATPFTKVTHVFYPFIIAFENNKKNPLNDSIYMLYEKHFIALIFFWKRKLDYISILSCVCTVQCTLLLSLWICLKKVRLNMLIKTQIKCIIYIDFN